MSEINQNDNINNNLSSNPSQIMSDKILPNNKNLKMELLQFKDEILKEIKYLKKSFTEKQEFTTSLIDDKFKKYETRLSNCNEKISDISSQIRENEDHNKDIQTLMEFKNKLRDSILTMDIKINNIDRESKNNIFRIDNLLSDSILYPGIIGSGAKFKTFHQMIDYMLAQMSQNITYHEKNTLDFNQLKKRMNTFEQNLQKVKESMSNEIQLMLNKKMEENEKQLKKIFDEYKQKLTGIKVENDEYIRDMQTTTLKFRRELEEFEFAKNKISNDIKEEGRLLIEENDKTQNIFRGYKKEFNLMKDRFTQLSEFVKDVRFRINLGQEVKRREYYHMSSKLDFTKKQKIENEKYINIYNNEYKDENNLPDFLRNNIIKEDNTLYKTDGFHSAGNKKTKKIGFLKKNKNKGRNYSSLEKLKEGQSNEFTSRENKTIKTNKTSDEIYDNSTDKNKISNRDDNINNDEEEKYSLFKNQFNNVNNKKSNKKNKKINNKLKRSNSMNQNGSTSNFKKQDNKNNFIYKNSTIMPILLDNKINEIEKNDEKKNENNINLKQIFREVNIKNKYKIIDNKNIIKKRDIKKLLENPEEKNSKNKIFMGLNNKENINQKNNNFLSERINLMPNLSNNNSDENQKIISEINKIESKKNSKIYFTPKATVKSLSRVQSALVSESKYPNISNNNNHHQPSQNLTPINNNIKKNIINDNATSFEENKLNNSLKNNNNNKGVNNVIPNKNYRTYRLKNYISPNVKILQHGVENLYENDSNYQRNSEADNLKGMIINLQKYISGYNSPSVKRKEIINENRKMHRNSDYFKLKDLINGNNNIKSQKNKPNLIQIGFNN